MNPCLTRLKIYLGLLALLFITDTLTAQTIDSSMLQHLEYRNLGPNRGGRVTAVAGIPSQAGTFYMGATGGGVWKTNDYGQHWRNVSDGYFATPSIGAIRVALTNPDIVYVGTGSDGMRSNVIAGKGVYKSTDAGKSWRRIGLEKAGQIGAVEIHPSNADVVFVAAIGQAFEANEERGLYRTTDGGRNWEKVLHISDTTGITDVEFHPTNPNILYATAWRGERKPWTIISGGKEGGVYRSMDGGDTWTKLEKGLPQGIIGKADLAVSRDKPNRVYALIEAPVGEGGLYRSNDKGENWKLMSTEKPLLDRPFYYCNVDANPGNANAVYVSATRFWISHNGGKDWTRRSTPHGDNHDLWINPRDTSIWVQCNDGGANVTRDAGYTWSTQSNQPTAELYQVEVDNRYPYWVYAGQQDNSTISIPSLPPSSRPSGPMGFWEAVGGCETGPAVPKPDNPNLVYANCKGRFGVYDRRTGQERSYYVGGQYMYGHNPKDLKYRFQRVSPIHVSPHDPDVVYHASQYLHRTTNHGREWETISPDLTAFEADKQVISGAPITRDITGEEFYSTIYAVRESPLEEGLIWVGANDGPVHVTRNGGKDWNKVTPQDLAPGGRVDCVEPSPHRAGKAYFSTMRYMLGDWKPYIYRTEDYGRSWTLLTDGDNGIPADYPVRVLREDPEREGLLYAGTEYGLFISTDDGANWQPLQQNLPITPITDIKVHRGDLVMSTMGRGFWILDDLSSLRAMAGGMEKTTVQLFQPRKTLRMRYPFYMDGELAPQYPRPGIVMDYSLQRNVSGPVKLEILDQDGEVIRAFTSEKPKETADADPAPSMRTGFFEKGYSEALSADAGTHRFRWDFRHAGAWDDNPERSGANGPMVAPGSYEVRLTAGGQTLSRSFELPIDPNVRKTGITIKDLQAQEALNLKVRNLHSQAKMLAAMVEGRLEELEKELEKEGADDQIHAEMRRLQALESELTTAEGRYRQPMLVAQIQYLSYMLRGADQRPGQDAYDRYEDLKAWYNRLLPRWEAIGGEAEVLRKMD